MTASLDRSQLQMQMGQEVIYLLLTSSLLGCVILAAYVLLHVRSVGELKGQVADLHVALARATGKGTPLDKPPIIVLRETDGFHFEPGSAEISLSFERRIRAEIVPQIASLARTYQATVIEVIGHTDGVPVGPNLRVKANLDFTLAAFVEGQQSEAPIPFDNAGLGMARAVTMAKMLRASGLGEGFEILPLSAGSLISPSDRYRPSEIKDNDATRRRIEIRLRRRHG
jgi:hypothetical protein